MISETQAFKNAQRAFAPVEMNVYATDDIPNTGIVGVLHQRNMLITACKAIHK